MPLIKLNTTQLLISYFIVWPFLQIMISLVCNRISDEHFSDNSFLLKTRKWEKEGRIYKSVFKIHKWKPILPDGARLYNNGFEKKNVKHFDSAYFEKFIIETGRAEINHWIQIMPFWIFILWSPSYVILPMFLYAMIVNFPCIIAQRYNRPRLRRTYKLLLDREMREKSQD